MKFATIDGSAGGHVGVLVAEDEILDLALLGEISPRARLVPGSLRGLRRTRRTRHRRFCP